MNLKSTKRAAHGYYPVMILICIGVMVSTLSFCAIYRWQLKEIQAAFELASRNRINALIREIDTSLMILGSVHSLHKSTGKFDRQTFRKFVTPLLLMNQSLRTLEWIPHVLHKEREIYENSARLDGYPDFQFTRFSEQGEICRAFNSKEYFPVYFVEPYLGNEPALGFDLASSPLRYQAIIKSLRTGKMAATQDFRRVQGPRNENCFLVFLPIHRELEPTENIQQRHQRISGFLLGVIRIEKIVEKALSSFGEDNIEIQIYDKLSSPSKHRLWPYLPYVPGSRPQPKVINDNDLCFDQMHYIADKKWMIRCKVKPGFIKGQMGRLPWLFLSGGLILTAIQAALLGRVLTRRRQRDQVLETLHNELDLRTEQMEHHAMMASVFEKTGEGILITDTNGTIQKVNPGFTAITGYAPKDAVGKSPRLLNSGRHDENFFKEMWKALITHGEWCGEIWNRRKNGEIYPEWIFVASISDSRGKTTHYVAIFHDISKLKKSEKEFEYQAFHDTLTDLPNRRLFYDRLGKALASARRTDQLVAVLFLDLDNFKNINDTMGHQVGDDLLKKVSRRLKTLCREEDTLARSGGDEFLFMLPRLKSGQQSVAFARRLLYSFSEPFFILKRQVFIGVSIGITLFPHDGEDGETLVKNSDIAMYRAKAQGKNNYKLFTRAMNDAVLRRSSLESSMRLAVEQKTFRVYYQPKIETQTNQVTGAEALARWELSGEEMISPSEFIPIAEETGIIFALGEWVLHTACSDLKKLHDRGYKGLTVAVNLSAKQFQDRNLLPLITGVLKETGLAPKALNLEITESIVIKDIDTTIKTLTNLAKMGVHISIDDFGTGYSSLSYLKKLPLDVLKIDRAFIRELPNNTDDVAITRAILSMACALKLRVVAEGVETEEQLKFLKANNCHEIQGYYFSKPMAFDDYSTYLQKGCKSII